MKPYIAVANKRIPAKAVRCVRCRWCHPKYMLACPKCSDTRAFDTSLQEERRERRVKNVKADGTGSTTRQRSAYAWS